MRNQNEFYNIYMPNLPSRFKICVVTVTYGNRFAYLKQVIDAVLAEGVTKVLVVDNNSSPESREQLKIYQKAFNNEKLKVLYLDDNYGSAGGYKRGLKEVLADNDCEFIWLLDDDNVPEKGSLDKLLKAYEYLGASSENILVSVRPIFQQDLNAVRRGRCIGYITNAFMGFHLKNVIFRKWCHTKKYVLNIKGIDLEKKNFFIIRSQVAPYGGLFFSKDVILKAGFPNEDFFVYADDHDWTFRMTKMGLNLYLCSEVIINDIHTTFNTNNSIHPHYLMGIDEKKIYYGIRNHVYVDKNFIDNKIVYFFNMTVSLLYFFFKHFFKSPFFSLKRFKLILRAVKDGLCGKLGRI